MADTIKTVTAKQCPFCGSTDVVLRHPFARECVECEAIASDCTVPSRWAATTQTTWSWTPGSVRRAANAAMADAEGEL